MRTYLYDTLLNAREDAKNSEEYDRKWGGWFEKKDWINWQRLMKALITRLDLLLASAEDVIEIMSVKEQNQERVIR